MLDIYGVLVTIEKLAEILSIGKNSDNKLLKFFPKPPMDDSKRKEFPIYL